MKLQETLEFILLLGIIILIAVGFFYYYIPLINKQHFSTGIVINDFQISDNGIGINPCEVNMSFKSTSNVFTANTFNILAQNYTGYNLNISVSTQNYSMYPLPTGEYQYTYNFPVSNSIFCNMFTQFSSSNSGEIKGLLLYVNGTPELYQFNPPIKTVSQP